MLSTFFFAFFIFSCVDCGSILCVLLFYNVSLFRYSYGNSHLCSFTFWQVPTEEINVVHAIDITEGSSNSDSATELVDLPESTATISCEVYPTVPRDINPEISMSRRRKMKNKMHSKNKYVMCNEGSDNVEVVCMP